MVPVHMVARRRTTGRLTGAVLLAALFAAPVPFPVSAQEDQSLLISELLREVRQLRAELSAVRNENEILRHRFEVLLDRLGVELEDSSARRRPASVPELAPVTEDFIRREPGRDGVAFPAATAGAQETSDPQRQPSEPDPLEPWRAKQAAPAQTLPGQTLAEPAPSTRKLVEQAASAPAPPERAAPAAPTAREPSRDGRRFALAGPRSRGSAQERAAYLGALAHLDTGRYDELRKALQRFLEDYPGGAYEAKAQYWIADSYYAEERYDQAARHFERYLERFPDADKADDARLKLADVHYKHDELPAAQRLLEKLVDSRNERVRKLAMRRLDSIVRASRR